MQSKPNSKETKCYIYEELGDKGSGQEGLVLGKINIIKACYICTYMKMSQNCMINMLINKKVSLI